MSNRYTNPGHSEKVIMWILVAILLPFWCAVVWALVVSQ